MEARLRAVLDTAQESVLAVDCEGRIALFNAACERLFGYRAREVIGRPVDELISPASSEAQVPSSAHRAPGLVEIGMHAATGWRKDGTQFPLELSVGSPVWAGSDLMIGIIHDLTERVRTEDDLRESAEQLRAVVDTAVDGVILIDMRGNIVMFNPACEKLFGYAREELIGQNVKVLMPTPFHEEHDGYLANYHKTGERKIIGIGREVMGRRKDGSTFPMDLSVGEARHRGEPLFVGIIRDITDRKREESHREELISQLTQSNEERGYFAHIASHDLKQSLRMVSAFCGLLQQRYSDRLDEQGREFLGLAASSALQMTDLLDDMLEYGRLITDEARSSWFDSGEIMRHVLDTLSEPINISRAVVTQDPLPMIYANPVRFTRLLENLIGNAIKYVAPGVQPRVHVSAQIAQDVWLFKVKDNGIGVSPEYRVQVFEPFKRLHTSSEYPGTGLGLSICKRIVEGFGGEMGIEENAEGGSTFTFTIKQRDAS